MVAALAARGYATDELRGDARLEGMGDGLWHLGRRLFWAGCGAALDREAWSAIAERYGLPVILLALPDPDFYHLDTALALLDEDACLWLPAAFDERGRELVRALFPRALEADEEDARARLACNATCPDGRTVLIQRGCDVTRGRLERAGFEVRELETGEYLKSGGSVFCMKLLHGPL